MTGETSSTTSEKCTPSPASAASLTRREAMLQLLRVGGVAAGAAGAGGWLSEPSFRPMPAQAEHARRAHRVAAAASLPQMTGGQGTARLSRRPTPIPKW